MEAPPKDDSEDSDEVREKKNFLKAAFHGKWSTHLLVEV